jgi:hypothetical protein
LHSFFEVGETNRTGDNSPHNRVKRIMSKLGEFYLIISNYYLNWFFSFQDTNNDGVLSEKEFVDGCANDASLRRLLAPHVSV